MSATPGPRSSRAVEKLDDYGKSIGLVLEPETLDKFAAYAALIDKWNRLTSLVRAHGVDEIIENHVVDCVSIAPLLLGRNVADIGSGAGLPGVVLALIQPQRHFFLVESNRRRCRFLQQTIVELALDNASVVTSRVEDWRPDELIDCLTSRAYGSLEKFCTDCSHLSHPRCRLVAMRGRLEDDQLDGVRARSESLEVVALDVPGRLHRHAVVVEGWHTR